LALFLFCSLAAIATPAQTFTTLADFDGTNGGGPGYMALIQGTDGNLYGTTHNGGPNPDCYIDGCGTIFRISSEGTLTTVYDFCPENPCADGTRPLAGLVQATNGSFYGTAYAGGANLLGTVYRITSGGTLTTLQSFFGITDGSYPEAGLVQAINGDFYGTTFEGGASGDGTVYKITADGTLTTLHNFDGLGDGGYPTSGLVQATNGDLYGTTNDGGNGIESEGTVYKITLGGTLTTLYSFCSQPNCADGANPFAGLIQATDGNFYGITSGGGGTSNKCSGGCGTVFKITPEGVLTTLYSFCSQAKCADGVSPVGGLVEATDGNFYGTTQQGGTNNTCVGFQGCGTIFEITPQGTLTTLYSFCSEAGCADGEAPFGGLAQATDGTFYGTTFEGGTGAYGTVFSLSVGLGPFVKTLPIAAKAGTEVRILGTALTGATKVTFDGTPARFAVQSPSLILARVPADAASGTVEVTLPGQTLSSNVPFYVLP
jgi:uncharacterized repeat protein (TIGR03803 family)